SPALSTAPARRTPATYSRLRGRSAPPSHCSAASIGPPPWHPSGSVRPHFLVRFVEQLSIEFGGLQTQSQKTAPPIGCRPPPPTPAEGGQPRFPARDSDEDAPPGRSAGS